MNILVIEDDKFTRKLISHHLLEEGYTVSAAGNGQEALTLLNRNTAIDVIVVDVLMPELTGPSFLLSIKKYFPKKLPVIFVLSGVHDGEEFLKKLGTHYDYFLPKPIDFALLNRLLQKVVVKQ